MGSAFLCAHLEVTNTPRIDHAQYCASWIAALKDDSKAIFTAASMATRAVDYLFNKQPKAGPDPHDTLPLEDGTPSRPTNCREGETALRTTGSDLNGGLRA